MTDKIKKAECKSVIKAIEEIITKRPEIDFANLFGSYARGTENPNSDLDIAVKLSGDKKEKLKIRLELMADLSGIAPRIDLIDIQSMNPLLAYKVAAEGVTIYAKDEKEVVRFRADAFGKYPDYKRLMAPHQEAMLKRIEENTYGE